MLSEEDVIWCYRTLLGREPESPAVIAQHRASQGLKALVETIYRSEEGQRRREASARPLPGSSPALAVARSETYRGYEPADLERLSVLRQSSAPRADAYTDAFGQRFAADIHPPVADWVGQVSEALPFPDDRHLAPGMEYAAGALALAAAEGQGGFCAVELGAGFGPWTSFFGLTARRLGFEQIHLAAFEADAGRYAQLRRHLALNGLVDEAAPAAGAAGPLSWQLFQAAAWWQDGEVYWPAGSDPLDAGLRAEASPEVTTDYRGRPVAHVPIPALDLARALRDSPTIDIVHADLQGSEAELIPRLIDFLDARVRSLFIGTHSRKIEGDLMELLYRRGWKLVREKPCRFALRREATHLEGRTNIDGGQYWINRNPAIAFARDPGWFPNPVAPVDVPKNFP